MKIALIGLGKMGQALAHRAIQAGHEMFGFDINADSCAVARNEGVTVVENIADFAQHDIHVFWLLVPQGELVDKVIAQLRPILKEKDVIVDAGNSKFSDSMRRAQDLALSDIYFVDCGTSGGVHGKENGFCLMVGGDKKAYAIIEPFLHSIAAQEGYAHVGPSGAGHYVKMVHNGIEYGLLQAYAEGFNVLKNGDFASDELNLAQISKLWNHGSVIRSWILDLVFNIMKEDQNLHDVIGSISSTGMGKWTVENAHKNNIQVPVIEESLKVREWSEKTGGDYATKIVACLRNQFGGHAVQKIKEK